VAARYGSEFKMRKKSLTAGLRKWKPRVQLSPTRMSARTSRFEELRRDFDAIVLAGGSDSRAT